MLLVVLLEAWHGVDEECIQPHVITMDWVSSGQPTRSRHQAPVWRRHNFQDLWISVSVSMKRSTATSLQGLLTCSFWVALLTLSSKSFLSLSNWFFFELYSASSSALRFFISDSNCNLSVWRVLNALLSWARFCCAVAKKPEVGLSLQRPNYFEG